GLILIVKKAWRVVLCTLSKLLFKMEIFLKGRRHFLGPVFAGQWIQLSFFAYAQIVDMNRKTR
ncbi:hypothetical protein, partial [Streptococcus dysgalactiae]|uniref:hypothetical protein n=1 Tax=Streptococcus dysgalactiae TaxID=1334 RepID=UPI0024B6EF0E